ncbi:MAG: class I SAM-dependent methyltransferase [Dehalococcoidales bacterium]|nr:class I SAM-dependent methyltransferase [Dehalococcoidales bacterium]
MGENVIYSSYDPFAWIYNKHWGNSFLPVLMPIVENLALSKLSPKARILDLCCGTGQLAQQFKTLGYRVTGIDGSAEMLNYARENAPGVKFIQADARSFKLTGQYDAVLSIFDSLNHVMTLKELKSVFSRVYDALRPSGLFFFDLNTEEGFKKEWQGNFNIIEDDHACLVLQTYKSATRTATYEITIFRLIDGSWYRKDMALYQKCHAPARVQSALKTAGFLEIEVYGFDWQYGVKALSQGSRRAFFLCRKPK